MFNNILDYSLITPTSLKNYNCKIVNFGNYCHVYFYENTKVKKEKDKKFLFFSPNTHQDEKKELNNNNLINNENKLKSIDIKNINRSKFNCQRIALANLDSWETFITLTYETNFIDVSISRQHFRYFVDKIRRVKKDFKYLCITEFQKRGAIHYHLLTNIKYSDDTLLYLQDDDPKYKHIKYWDYGFTSIEVIKDNREKIVNYVSKYMTKDLDQRLFSKRRYLYSRNLNMPKDTFIDLADKKSYLHFIQYLKNYNVNKNYLYLNKYDNTNITFLELIKSNTQI